MTLHYSGLWTAALCIRSIFDHEADSPRKLNAKSVAGSTPRVREQIADYWTTKNTAKVDARLAVAFIARFLARTAVPVNQACKSDCILTRRIALIKAFADRGVAHLSLHHFEFTARDLAHSVAAAALVGAIIRHFDEPTGAGATYLTSIDKAAHAAAVRIFPEFQRVPRLFTDDFIHGTLRNLYSGRLMDGVEYLSESLLSALGWDDAGAV